MLEDYFWRSFENCLFEDIFKFIDEIFLEDNSLIVKKALRICRV